jgi:multiple sugar transport system permease protein
MTAVGSIRSLRAGTRREAGRRDWVGYLFVLPFLAVFGVFVLYPALYGVWISLHNWDFFLAERPFIGLENYLTLFDPQSITARQFWSSMLATGKFVLFSVPFLVTVPLALAILLNRRFRGRTVFRAIVFAPFVLGVAVIALIWQVLLSSQLGLVNFLAGLVGLPADTPWLTGTPWVWISLVAVTLWWTLGFNTVIYLAGLQDIDETLYDAAKVDGANRWQEFVNVTLPGLKPVLIFILITTIIASANMFGQSYLLTNGGPSNETRTAIMYISQIGLQQFRMGGAAAMSFVLAAALILVSVANLLLMRSRKGS